MSRRNLIDPHADGSGSASDSSGCVEGDDQQRLLNSHVRTRSNNPFLASDEEDGMGSADSFTNYNHENGQDLSLLDIREHNHNSISAYKGYYSKNNSTLAANQQSQHLIPPEKRALSQGAPSSTSPDIYSPQEFDRYPLVGSRVGSTSQLNGRANGSPMLDDYSNAYHRDDTFSSLSSNQIISEHDFSPFGGYPATSFPLLLDEKEDDDYLHNPDPEEEAMLDKNRYMHDFKNMDRRSFGGWLGIFILIGGAIAVFVVLPAVTFTGAMDHNNTGQVVEFLSPYQYPQLSAIRTSLVDPDTPSYAMTRKSRLGEDWKLVFSDEFNAEGRTFYEGDDQFWTGPDFHYAATKDLEWYTPDAITTREGALRLRMDAFRNHNLYYRSGMLQSWNKFCFTQGALEVSANLPNYGRVTGLWPGMWTMGNLGRPGYLGSTEGLWPYSYQSCDAGITPNQSSPDGISYLPGQRLSVCTCDGEDHPNQGVGRGAPEIDILEGETDTKLGVGVASQSMQLAPFDIWYMPDYDFIEVYNFSTTVMNTYAGGPLQQAVSAVTTLNTSWYEFGPGSGYYQNYAIEIISSGKDEDTYCTWYVGNTPTFTVYGDALHPSGNIGRRYVSKEPMSIILNLGISNNWAYIDWQSIYFPVTMSIDYVRVYQPSDQISVTCDPDDYPTYDYIQSHLNVYTNPNITSWESAGYSFPKNILTGNCKSSKFSFS